MPRARKSDARPNVVEPIDADISTPTNVSLRGRPRLRLVVQLGGFVIEREPAHPREAR